MYIDPISSIIFSLSPSNFLRFIMFHSLFVFYFAITTRTTCCGWISLSISQRDIEFMVLFSTRQVYTQGSFLRSRPHLLIFCTSILDDVMKTSNLTSLFSECRCATLTGKVFWHITDTLTLPTLCTHPKKTCK